MTQEHTTQDGKGVFKDKDKYGGRKTSLGNEEKIMFAHSILKDLHEDSERALKILGFEYYEE